MNEFQAPVNRTNDNGYLTSVNLGSTDRIIGGVLVAILIALILWVGTTTQQNTVAIATLSEKFESVKRDRDLSLIYIEKRLEKLELGLADIKEDYQDKPRRHSLE